MTRKDYITLAAALKDARLRDPDGALSMERDKRIRQQATVMVDAIADALAHDNPRFDRDRFYIAAGFGSLALSRNVEDAP